MTIDLSKNYRTRDGREVKLLMTDRGDKRYPVLGAILLSDGVWTPDTWTSEGTCVISYGSHARDLIEVKPRIRRTVWVNLYPDMDDYVHNSKAEADKNCGPFRVACVKVEIDCEEGEGL